MVIANASRPNPRVTIGFLIENFFW
jgi:hypothetical protein